MELIVTDNTYQSGNALFLYSGDMQFESRSGYWLETKFSLFPSVSRANHANSILTVLPRQAVDKVFIWGIQVS
jgi:hypothetical protein